MWSLWFLTSVACGICPEAQLDPADVNSTTSDVVDVVHCDVRLLTNWGHPGQMSD